MKIKPPPPLIDELTVLFYALITKNGEKHHASKETRCLAICRTPKHGGECPDYLLYECNARWQTRGGLYGKSIEYLKRVAESKFKVIPTQWIIPDYTKKQVAQYLLDVDNEWNAYLKNIITAIKEKLKNKTVRCCVCKKLTNDPRFSFNFKTPVRYGDTETVPVSVASNLRNVKCFHAACKDEFLKSRDIRRENGHWIVHKPKADS